MPFVPDSPVEMPDGTLRCQRHGLEICGFCCCDYTFMRDTFEEQEEAAVRIDKTDDDEDGPVEMPDGTLRCRLHGLEICGSCCCDYTFMRDVLEEQEEEEAAKRMQESDKADDDEDGAVEMPDGTLRCRQHYLEICGICCRDYTFMRDHLEEQEEAAKEDWAPYEEEQTKTKLVLCNVCSKECQKKCSVCKSVFYCGPEHQRQDWPLHKAKCIPQTLRTRA